MARERTKRDIGLKDFYRFYKDKKNEGIKTKSKTLVTYEKYAKVISLFNKKIAEEIIIKSYDYKIPHRLGVLCVRKTKLTPCILPNGKVKITNSVNWKATLDLWKKDEDAKTNKKLIRHLNEHTDGYSFKFWLLKPPARFINKTFYYFKASRNNNRTLAKVLKDENLNIDYYLK